MTNTVVQEAPRLPGCGNYRRAEFSSDMAYRYSLLDVWDGVLPRLDFIMLNPSTADAMQDDPTVRRCLGFARSLDYGSLLVLNIFAHRATDPQALRTCIDPVGPLNDQFLCEEAAHCSLVIGAWGVHGALNDRAEAVEKMLHADLHCLAITKSGFPAHPLSICPPTTSP